PGNVAPAQAVAAQRILARGPAIERVQQTQQTVPQALELRQGLVIAIFGNERRLADIPLAAYVPFAEMAGGVTCLVERARQCGRLGVSHWASPRCSFSLREARYELMRQRAGNSPVVSA